MKLRGARLAATVLGAAAVTAGLAPPAQANPLSGLRGSPMHATEAASATTEPLQLGRTLLDLSDPDGCLPVRERSRNSPLVDPRVRYQLTWVFDMHPNLYGSSAPRAVVFACYIYPCLHLLPLHGKSTCKLTPC